MMLGFTAINNARRLNGMPDMDQFRRASGEFPTRWDAAITACRTAPDKLFIDIFQPEGEAMRRLAGG